MKSNVVQIIESELEKYQSERVCFDNTGHDDRWCSVCEDMRSGAEAFAERIKNCLRAVRGKR